MTSTARWSIPCEDRDFVEWHRGCGWCAVWVVLIDAPEVVQAMHLARQRLGPALLPRHARQPHITLAYRGLCAPGGHPNEECSATTVQADVRALQQARAAPFTLQLGGAGSFETVPYLGVREPAPLQQLHTTLNKAVDTHLHGLAPWTYVPHVTIGHYARRLPLQHALAALALHDWSAAAIAVHDIALVRYASADIAGPLEVEGRYDLHHGRYTPSEQAIWPEVNTAAGRCGNASRAETMENPTN